MSNIVKRIINITVQRSALVLNSITNLATQVTGVLPQVNGGTGATTAAQARTNLGAQAQDADLDAIAALTGTSGFLKKTAANTWQLDTTTYLTGSEIGLTIQGYDADLQAIGALTGGTGILQKISAGNWTLNTNEFTLSNGTNATGTWGISITGNAGNVTGTVAVANGGTGATTAAQARTNLGATTAGANIYTLANPNSVSYIRINADNSVSTRTATELRSDINAQIAGNYATTDTQQLISGSKTHTQLFGAQSGVVLPYNQQVGWGTAGLGTNAIDNNWRIAMTTSTHPVTTTLITGNRTTIVTSNSGSDGFAVGSNSGTAHFEVTGGGRIRLPIGTIAAPATATSTGIAGEIRLANGFIYVCIANNTWQRATLSTW